MVVWILTGLWHGAEWNFIIWGIYFGILLIIEKLFLLKKTEKIPKFLKVIYTLFLVMISFIIFNGNEIIENIKGLFGIGNISFISKESIYYLKSYFIVILNRNNRSNTYYEKYSEKRKNKENYKYIRTNLFI